MMDPKTLHIVDVAWARDRLPQRRGDAHKWSVGGVVIIAGSPQYTGAAWLASRAAGRAGAGIAYLATGRSVLQMIAGTIPEVAHIPLPSTESSSGVRSAVDAIRPHLARARAVVIGPGLGDDEPAHLLLSALFGLHGKGDTTAAIGFGTTPRASQPADEPGILFSKATCPIVVDADALNWLARQEHWWDRLPAGRLVLTPHPGELGRLTGSTSEPMSAANLRARARQWQQTVVAKGAPTRASDGETVLEADRSPVALATAGSGDVFAGTIGGLIAQGMTALDAAGVAMVLGTLAADLTAAEFGPEGVLATDLPDAIARSHRQIMDER